MYISVEEIKSIDSQHLLDNLTNDQIEDYIQIAEELINYNINRVYDNLNLPFGIKKATGQLVFYLISTDNTMNYNEFGNKNIKREMIKAGQVAEETEYFEGFSIEKYSLPKHILFLIQPYINKKLNSYIEVYINE